MKSWSLNAVEEIYSNIALSCRIYNILEINSPIEYFYKLMWESRLWIVLKISPDVKLQLQNTYYVIFENFQSNHNYFLPPDICDDKQRLNIISLQRTTDYCSVGVAVSCMPINVQLSWHFRDTRFISVPLEGRDMNFHLSHRASAHQRFYQNQPVLLNCIDIVS